MELNEQRPIVHQVAAQYWDRPSSEVGDALQDITVIKRTGGKIMGFLPAFNGRPEVFYKVYFYDRGFNFESSGLKAANAMPQVEGVTVPEVVAIYPEYKAILTVKEDWEEDRSDLQRFFVGSLGIDWFKVGRWLRTFHDSQVSHERNDYFLRKKFEKIESHLEDLQGLFSGEQIGKMRQIIEDARKYFETTQIEWVISHGDFGLSNIQKKGDMMEIIDFEDCQIAPRVFDILNCVIRLGYLGFFPHKKDTYHEIKDQIFKGYNIKIAETSADYFLHLLIDLDLLMAYARHNQKIKNNLLERIVSFYFKFQTQKRLENWLQNVP